MKQRPEADITRAGAMPETSLAEDLRCPGLRFFWALVLVKIADRLIYGALKIAGLGIPKALTGRRGSFMLHRLGFAKSSALIDGQMRPFVRRRSRRSKALLPPELPFKTPLESSSALDEIYVEKSYMPGASPEDPAYGRLAGVGPVAYHVGEE